jgi:lipoate-protein ligase A
MAKFSASLVAALGSLGIRAQFRGKNDVEVQGRKIAGMGIYRATGGGLLFHASLLIDLDVALMLQVLNTPFEKFSDKEIDSVASRISTVRREIGSGISVDEVRRTVAAAYSVKWDVELVPGDFTDPERQAIAELERDKYRTDEWIFQASQVPDASGSAKRKTPGGLLDVRVSLAGKMVKMVFLAGDFFAAEASVRDLEAALRWHPGSPDAVAATVKEVYARNPAGWHAISADELTDSILLAIERAELTENRTESHPYGCFVPLGR